MGTLLSVEVESVLASYASQIDERLDQLLPPESLEPAVLHEAMRYSCLAPGKRIRPALCIASCEAAGGSVSQARDAGCALEFVHCFSLIHDDLPAIDNDDYRRGRPTCHKRFGEAMAILAGDALFALAFQTLASIPAPAEAIRDSLQELALAAGSAGLVGGEVMDVLAENTSPAKPEVLAIHGRKTGALLAASCAIGGIMARASDEQVRRLRQFGHALGLAFQITDDVLNETSSLSVLGKAAGSDRRKEKATLPRVEGISGSVSEAQTYASRAVSLLGDEFADVSTLAQIAQFVVHRAT